MEAAWKIDAAAIARWRKFVNANIGNKLVLERRLRNVEGQGVVLTRGAIWKVLVGCQVTTQQRSGPDSAVSRFLASKSPALSYQKCSNSRDLPKMLKRELKSAGLRRGNKVAENLRTILGDLKGGGWPELEAQLRGLRDETSQEKELRVVHYLCSKSFPGLGPKQSRNFIQWLGLARHEIPLDSRVLKAMKRMGCTFVPSANALGDETVYRFVEEGLQKVAGVLSIYPCILDACIFSSFDAKPLKGAGADGVRGVAKGARRR